MKLLDLAQEFAQLNLFNSDTQSAVLGIAKIFSERSNVEKIHDIDLNALALFKERTLALALPITYNGYLKYLRIIGDYAVAKEVVQTNIFRSVKLATIGKHPPKVIDTDDLALLEQYLIDNPNSCKPHWFWLAVINCLYYTGMRRRQLITLRRSDLDFRNRSILLSYQGSKTLREWRIPMHDALAIHLEEYIRSMELHSGRKLGQSDFLFQIGRVNDRYETDEKTGKMTASSITGFFKRLSKNSGVRIGAHRFRHTLATTLCNPTDETPPDIFAAQEILGHTNLQTTRGYVNMSFQRMGKAMNTITKKGEMHAKNLTEV